MRNLMLGIALIITLFSTITLFAQDGAAQFQPIAINVQQSVPVLADVAMQHDGETITATLPLTVDVNLQISIRGEAVTITVLTPTQPANVVLSTPISVPTGELIVLGDAEWALLGSEDLGQELAKTVLFPERNTTGRFVAVTYELRNLSEESIYFAGTDLVDGTGRFYEPLIALQHYVADEQLQCAIEPINSGLKKRCQVIYEVPIDASGLQIEFTNLADRNPETKLVDLGLE